MSSQLTDHRVVDRQIDEMVSEGIKLFAPASSSKATRTTAQHARAAEAGAATARGLVDRSETIGIDELSHVPAVARVMGVQAYLLTCTPFSPSPNLPSARRFAGILVQARLI